MSEEGTQQGDPQGPLLSCPAIQPLLNSLNSGFAAGYKDAFTVGGAEIDVDRDVLWNMSSKLARQYFQM